nr:Rieske 2Fe-2S domain-containing protein [Magnetospirillum sulfuroxidans]
MCRLADLSDPGARGPFIVTLAGERKQVFVVLTDGQVRAYVNSCPHVGAPLEMEENRYLDLTGSEIICAVHAARFDLLTGDCTWGPCRGRRLTPVAITIADGMIVADNPPNLS